MWAPNWELYSEKKHQKVWKHQDQELYISYRGSRPAELHSGKSTPSNYIVFVQGPDTEPVEMVEMGVAQEWEANRIAHDWMREHP